MVTIVPPAAVPFDGTIRSIVEGTAAIEEFHRDGMRRMVTRMVMDLHDSSSYSG